MNERLSLATCCTSTHHTTPRGERKLSFGWPFLGKNYEEIGSVPYRDSPRDPALLLYSAAWGALLYAFIEQIASGQSRLAWISGALLTGAAAVGAWNAIERAGVRTCTAREG
jgi:hypothetical protein